MNLILLVTCVRSGDYIMVKREALAIAAAPMDRATRGGDPTIGVS